MIDSSMWLSRSVDDDHHHHEFDQKDDVSEDVTSIDLTSVCTAPYAAVSVAPIADDGNGGGDGPVITCMVCVCVCIHHISITMQLFHTIQKSSVVSVGSFLYFHNDNND